MYYKMWKPSLSNNNVLPGHIANNLFRNWIATYKWSITTHNTYISQKQKSNFHISRRVIYRQQKHFRVDMTSLLNIPDSQQHFDFSNFEIREVLILQIHIIWNTFDDRKVVYLHLFEMKLLSDINRREIILPFQLLLFIVSCKMF